MRKYFGTDGVRGVANVELTPELAFKLGKSAGHVLTKNRKGNQPPCFIVGRDTRISGRMLEAALTSGLTSVGVNVIQLGVIPTPGVAYLTKKLADGGAIISASHNPFQDNGIKLFNQDGFKLTDSAELEIEHYLDNIYDIPVHSGDRIGVVEDGRSTVTQYVDFLRSTVSTILNGMSIVLDCANGAASSIAPLLFNSLGAQVHLLSHTPDGLNINVDCGSTHPENLQKAVLEHKADLGLAFDGDADRLIAVDNTGEIMDGDQILYICAKALAKRNKLSKQTVVSTVMSNFGFQKALSNVGIISTQTKVGDRYVLEEMLKNGYVLGGEQSGHIIFLEHNTTGDGILSALQLVYNIKNEAVSASTLLDDFKKYPQELINVKVKDKKAWESNPVIRNAITNAEKELEGNGRILVRPSGTENLVRVMVEGEEVNLVRRLAYSIAGEIKKS